MTYRKKLIEVALPLVAINAASAREKSIRHGHPSTLHLWWARRPLAACRAVLFASLVDDPSEHPEEFPTEQAQEKERERLFRLIEELVKWENSNNENVLREARAEIHKSTGGNPPPVFDPFAGGGSIPLEAQRLGLEAHASDLNPVAVLINKALIEIPPKFAGRPPVNPEARQSLMSGDWSGARGLADDIRYYGKWMRDEAERRIGYLYPKVTLPKEYGGGEATVIAWLWTRTVTCPNPACGAKMPLVRSFFLSKKKGKEAWVEPHVDHTLTPPAIHFSVETGKGKTQDGTIDRRGAICIACKTSVPLSYIRSEAQASRMQVAPLAIVAEGQRGRVYLAPIDEHEQVARSAKPKWKPTELVTTPSHDVDRLPMYGMYTWGDAFTPRQLVALTTFSDLVSEAREHVLRDMGLTPLPPSPSLMERGAKMERGERQTMQEPGGSLVSLPAQEGGTERAATSSPSPAQRESASSPSPAPTERASSPSPSKMERGLGGEARRALCRNLRQRQTPAEEFFWELVRDRRFEGYKFRRQHPLSRFIADFYCPELRLAVELDGGIHTMQVERDRARDEILAQHDIRVVRIRNEGFLADPEVTLAQLSDLIAHWTTQDEVASAPTPTHADAQAYADTIGIYLACGIDRLVDRGSTIASWQTIGEKIRNTFARQAIPMVWDFAEANPFSESSGNFFDAIMWIVEVVEALPTNCPQGIVGQRDATTVINESIYPLISTDPPYYDNIGYADLSDFFYVWLRRSLYDIHSDLFKTMLVPKAQELIAASNRFDGSKSKAQEFFEKGLGKAFERLRAAQHPDYPLTVYYAFKQAESETEEDEEYEETASGNGFIVSASTGWETMLEGLIHAGFTITGTWPMRTERKGRTIGVGTNALASSIVLVCRPRPVDAPVASRRQFLNALRAELPAALKKLQHGSIAPVDLAQASIGPGMAIYSRYSKVVESDGTPLRVRTALQLINRALDEALAEQEGEYDAETRWAIAWFEQYAMNAGEYGIAETLSKAKNTTVQSLVDAGLLEARAGKVRLLKREELPEAWNPKASRLTVWEVMQRMIHELLDGKGDSGAGDILRKASAQGEAARDLAYRLYTVCERKGWAQEALAYNSLVTSWSEISRLAHREAADGSLWGATFLG